MYKNIIICARVLIAVVGLGRAEEAKMEGLPQGILDANPVIVEAKPIASDNAQVQGRANADGFQPVVIADLIAKVNSGNN